MIPHVVILYDQPMLPENHPDQASEYDVLFTMKAVQDCLLEAGYDVSLLSVAHNPDPMLAGLRQLRPDAIFNLCEGSVARAEIELFAASFMEWLCIPFTGCPASSLRLCLDKSLAKYLLRGAGLPTPDFLVVQAAPAPPCPFPWPVMVKPGAQDGSAGIDQGSVVTNQQQLDERVASLLKQYGPPVLVEEFIDGRELKIGMIELPDLLPLPISEIKHIPASADWWPILTSDAKWEPGSRDDLATPRVFPDDLSPELAEELRRQAIQAFRIFGCRDFASVDFRLNREGKPFILEVNPNPDFNPGAGFAAQMEKAGITWAAFTVKLTEAALRRAGKPTTPDPASTSLPQEAAPT
jgi:D-alanine-D-alanine ligase